MPAYEFIAKVGNKIVARVLIPLSVSDRNRVKWTRAALPEKLAIAGSAQNPDAQAHTMLRAYRRAEQRIGTNREFHNRIQHTPAQIKAAWAS